MANFNRTHYRIIAKAIRDSRSSAGIDILLADRLVSLLSFHFSIDNPRFNASAFHKACKPSDH